MYIEKMQCAHTIIQDIYRFETSIVEFLHKHKRGWSSNEQARPIVPLMDLVYIDESKEVEGVE